MPRLIANKKFTYRTRVIMPGHEFDASDEDARLLCGFGSAERKAEPQEQDAATSEPKRYRRRDMRAES